MKSTKNIYTFKHKIKEHFSKIYRKRKMTYMSSIKTRLSLSLPIVVWPYKLCVIPKATTIWYSKGTAIWNSNLVLWYIPGVPKEEVPAFDGTQKKSV